MSEGDNKESLDATLPSNEDSSEILHNTASNEIDHASGMKRERSEEGPSQETPAKEVKVRERRSRFSDKPPETAPAAQIDPSTILSNIASIINAQLSGLSSSVTTAQSQQLVTPKESRELFVGNVLANGVSDTVLKEFLNSAMRQVGLATGPEDPIVTCRMSAKFSFIELRTPDDSKNALSLNGIPFMGQCLKISRPSKYVGPPHQAKTWQEITGQAPVSSVEVNEYRILDLELRVSDFLHA